MSFFCEAQCKIVQHTHFLIADCIDSKVHCSQTCMSIYLSICLYCGFWTNWTFILVFASLWPRYGPWPPCWGLKLWMSWLWVRVRGLQVYPLFVCHCVIYDCQLSHVITTGWVKTFYSSLRFSGNISPNNNNNNNDRLTAFDPGQPG